MTLLIHCRRLDACSYHSEDDPNYEQPEQDSDKSDSDSTNSEDAEDVEEVKGEDVEVVEVVSPYFSNPLPNLTHTRAGAG